MSFVMFLCVAMFVLWLALAIMSGDGMPGLMDILNKPPLNSSYNFSVNDTLNLTLKGSEKQ